ncbi:MAG: fasciclin domain-containing protein [Planctomycetota bacterium]
MKRSFLAIAILLVCPLIAFADDDILTTAAANGSFDTLVSLVIAADLDDALGSHGEFTVFAPSDAAFEKLPEGTLDELRKPENREALAAILKYHVIGSEITIADHPPSHPIRSAETLQGDEVRFVRDGNDVSVNDSMVTARNISCSNGIIHVIDGVLLPPEDDNSIVGVAAEAGSFNTLLAAAEAAGLVDALKGDGPLTVFAPTDDAFSALPEGTVESLLKPENRDQLATILKYHVVSGKVTAREAVRLGFAETLAGPNVTVSIRDGRLSINDSNVISNDVEADNGIIHVIDKVLLPSDGETHTSATGSTSADTPDEITITSSWDNPVTRDGVTANRIIIRCNGAGRINLTNVQAHEIVTRVSGGGSVSIDGTVESHEVVVSGGGLLRARDLVTADTQIQVNGGGIATVNATGTLKASANGGATLRYVDTGAEIEKSINRYAEFVAITAEASHH